jgi:hypothetical protein
MSVRKITASFTATNQVSDVFSGLNACITVLCDGATGGGDAVASLQARAPGSTAWAGVAENTADGPLLFTFRDDASLSVGPIWGDLEFRLICTQVTAGTTAFTAWIVS